MGHFFRFPHFLSRSLFRAFWWNSFLFESGQHCTQSTNYAHVVWTSQLIRAHYLVSIGAYLVATRWSENQESLMQLFDRPSYAAYMASRRADKERRTKSNPFTLHIPLSFLSHHIPSLLQVHLSIFISTSIPFSLALPLYLSWLSIGTFYFFFQTVRPAWCVGHISTRA